MKQNNIASNKLIIFILLTTIFTLLSVSYVTAVFDWTPFTAFSGTTAPYASNGPGCKGFGGGGQQMTVGQGCTNTNDPVYDMGAVWTDINSNYLAWKIGFMNLSNLTACGGAINTATQWGVAVEFDSDSNRSSGCRMPDMNISFNQNNTGDSCYPGADYRFFVYADGTTQFDIYNRTLNTCANNSLPQQNRTCFQTMDQSNPLYNLTTELSCNTQTLLIAINRSAITNLVGMTFQTNTIKQAGFAGPVDMLGGFSFGESGGGFADNVMLGGSQDLMHNTQHPCRTITSQSNCTSTSNVSNTIYNCFWDSMPNTCNPDFRGGSMGGMTCADFCGACNTTTAACLAGGRGKCKVVTAPSNLPPGMTAFETDKMCVEDPTKFQFGSTGSNSGSCDTDCHQCFSNSTCITSNYPNPLGSGAGCQWIVDTRFDKSWCDLSTASFNFTCGSGNQLERCLNQTACEVATGNWSNSFHMCYNESQELCFDGEDNDADTQIDCADIDCSKDPACGGNINLLTGGFGLDPFEAMKKQMFQNMDPSPPVMLSPDSPDGLRGDIDALGFSIKDMGTSLGMGLDVVNISESLLCGGLNAQKYYYLIDSDTNSSSGCTVNISGTNHTGFEYKVEYLVQNNGSNGPQEIRRAYRCLNGDFGLYSAKLAGAPTQAAFGGISISCQASVAIVAIDKTDIGNPTSNLRFMAATSDNNTLLNAANDTNLGPGDNGIYYTPGTIDFKPSDCSQNPTACGTAFSLIGGGRFMPFEDCFTENQNDEDMDGQTNCVDSDCQMAPWCAGQYNLSADKTAPTVISINTNTFNNFVSQDSITNEPTNVTTTLHTVCTASAATYTIYDVGNPSFTQDDYRPFHHLGIKNGDLDSLGATITLAPSTTYNYKLKVCDQAGNCATSGCLNFTTSATSSQIPSKFDFESNSPLTSGTTIKFWNGTGFINVTPGATTNSSFMQNATLKFDNPGSSWGIDLEGIDLSKSTNINLTNAFNITNTSGKTYVGMTNQKWLEMSQALGAEAILITLPNNDPSSFANNKLVKCNENNVSDCNDVTSQATKVSGGTGSSNTTWRIPTSLGFSVYTGGDNTTYNLTFANLNTTQTINGTVNATYLLNVTNADTSNRTYNFSASTTPAGTTSLINGSSVFQANITNGSSIIIELTINGTTSGVYQTEVIATLSNDSAVVLNSTSDLGSPIITNIDTTGPTISLVTTNATWTNNNQSSFSFNFTDTFSANASCNLFVDGTNYNASLVTLNNTNTAITPNVTLADGTRTWYVNCTDLYNNEATSTPRTLNIDTSAPTVNSLTPADSAWNNSATPAFTFNYTDALASTSSCVLYINNTAYGTNSSVANNTNTAITANASLTSGNYNWQVNCTDLASNLGNSSVRTVKVDVTTPVSLINSINSKATSPAGTTNDTLTINFTATDANIQNWTIRIYNSSFGLVNNVSANTSNTSAVVTYTTAANGTYYVNLTTVDNATNSNTSSFTIYVDNTNPLINSLATSSITTTGATLTVNATDALSGIDYCSYSGANTGNLTLSSGLYTATLSSLTASTSYTVNVTCYDLAANTQSNTTTFTTSTASSSSSSSSSSGGSGGGATGSAGGVATGVAGQFEKKIWSSINKDEAATVSVKDGGLGITSIEFTAIKTVWGAWVQVNKRTTLPSTVTAHGNNVYSYVEVTRSSTLTDNTFKNAKMNFKVDKSWLTEKKLGPEQVSLFHYENGKWSELKTAVASQDGSYAYYSAETPGFSYFAIAQNMATAAPKAAVTPPALETTTTPVETSTSTPAETTSATEEVVEKEGKNTNWVWVLVGLVAVALVAIIYELKKRR